MDNTHALAESTACREATEAEPALLKVLGEIPDRWVGAVATLLLVQGMEDRLEEGGLTDSLVMAAMVGLTMAHVAMHVMDNPVARAAIEVIAKELGDGQG